MSEFNASLLREKFIIHDAMPADLSDREPVIALSNRLVLPLRGGKDVDSEVFVVRAQNMHTCVRLAALLAKEFSENGRLLGRPKPYDFSEAYKTVTKGYEEKWNKNRWAIIYHRGRAIFSEGPGEPHPFLDIIEQCDARNRGDYTKAVSVAEDAFKQAGKLVNIKHDSNIALVMNITEDEGKCGVIVRGPSRSTTFNMTVRKKADREVSLSQCMSSSAAYLEGIQLAFLVGMAGEKLHFEMISASSEEAKQADEARKRLSRLNVAVSQFESLLDVSYRPERPDFAELVDDAAKFARKILTEEMEIKIKAGGEEAGKWVL